MKDRVEVNSVVILGDTHRDISLINALHSKIQTGDLIIQLGDFGYYPRTIAGKEYLETLDAYLKDIDANLIWIDGNHEDHPSLRANWTTDSVFLGKSHDIFELQRIHYMPRGSTATINDLKYLFVGGASSVNGPLDNKWYPEEEMESLDWAMDLAENLEDVDVIVSHDSPICYNLNWPEHFCSAMTLPETWQVSRRCAESTFLVRVLVRLLKPKVLFHGHWHLARATNLFGAEIFAIGHLQGRSPWVVYFDEEELSARPA